MDWLTWLIAAVIVGIVVLIVVNDIRKKKKGEGSCSCGCSGCAMKDSCHPKQDK